MFHDESVGTIHCSFCGKSQDQVKKIIAGPDVYICNECVCLLYTSDAADERSSVDLGGRRIIKKKKTRHRISDDTTQRHTMYCQHTHALLDK